MDIRSQARGIPSSLTSPGRFSGRAWPSAVSEGESTAQTELCKAKDSAVVYTVWQDKDLPLTESEIRNEQGDLKACVLPLEGPRVSQVHL